MDSRNLRRGWRLGGPIFVVGFIASLVFGAVLARGSVFLPTATAGQLRGYYDHSGTAVAVSSLLQLVAAAGLLRFGLGVSAAVGADRRARFAMWLAAGAFAVSSVLALALAAVAARAGDGTLLVLARLTLAVGGPIHLTGLAGLLWYVSRRALAQGRGPRWLVLFGVAVGPLLLLSLVSIPVPAVTRAEPLWRLLAAVWITGVSAVGLDRTAPGAAGAVSPRTGTDSSATG
ncbi:hypothetical protein P3T27_006850 [Kitasatospora sp. MAA19]|uniref:hypothetical protein n=1 Tax=unclassified Kitasatospora TaxID=2633591 RepID=UPI0024735E37|nr:hypothetical protein [Kitasatospora sp. MAA19]MDH6710101.1 hypothetical protein [Kitasatospora sp. MAA19]